MKINYSVQEIHHRIFSIQFDNRYDCGMFFLRYQEFYESPSDRFRGKKYKLLDYMKWYVDEYTENSFNYPERWSGYNFPGDIIYQVNNLGFEDRNDYDISMLELYQDCTIKYPDKKFYIIGSMKSDLSTLNHEIAHGLFYLGDFYKKHMIDCIDSLGFKTKSKIFKRLLSFGYTESVFNDELQAYFATSDILSLKRMFKLTDKEVKCANIFTNVFNNFLKEAQLQNV